jgi:hypothetical protein
MRRLNPPGETNDGVRAAAWDAWRQILGGKPAADRLVWADRLREMPDRQRVYLDQLVQALSNHNPAAPELNAARERLATLLTAQGDASAALPIWQRLLADREAAGDPGAASTSVKVLSTALASGRHDVVAEMLTRLATAPPDAREAAAVATATAVDTLAAARDLESLRPLLTALGPVDLSPYGEALQTAVANATATLNEPVPPPATAPATTTPTTTVPAA